MTTGDVIIPDPLLACFIDLDGTLADTTPSLYNLYVTFLENHGITPTRDEFRSLDGSPLWEAFVYLNEHHHLGLTPNELESEYRHLLEEHTSQGPPLFPHVRETLTALHAAGVHLGLVTAASPSYVEDFLEKAGLAPLFSSITTAPEVGVHKPDPAIYHQALIAAGVFPAEAIAIEDSISGTTAASEADILTLWVFAPKNHPHSAHVHPIVDWAQIKSLLTP